MVDIRPCADQLFYFFFWKSRISWLSSLWSIRIWPSKGFATYLLRTAWGEPHLAIEKSLTNKKIQECCKAHLPLSPYTWLSRQCQSKSIWKLGINQSTPARNQVLQFLNSSPSSEQGNHILHKTQMIWISCCNTHLLDNMPMQYNGGPTSSSFWLQVPLDTCRRKITWRKEFASKPKETSFSALNWNGPQT